MSIQQEILGVRVDMPGTYILSADALGSVAQGQILDTNSHRLYPPQSMVALITRGEWQAYTGQQSALAVFLSGIQRIAAPPVLAAKFNPNHDEHGHFASSDSSGDTSTARPGSTETYLKQITSLTEAHIPAGWKYGSQEAYVLARGKQMPGTARPAGVKLGTLKQCFKNATELVLSHANWAYAEGFATPGDLPIAVLHAWAVDEKGTVVDNTFRDAKSTDYFGVVYPREQYLDYVAGQKYYGVLGGDYKAVAQVLKDGGLPPAGKASRHRQMYAHLVEAPFAEKFNDIHEADGRFGSGGSDTSLTSQYKDWGTSLSQEQRTAVVDYTSDMSTVMNGALRDGEHFQEAETLRSALALAPPLSDHLTVYRNMPSNIRIGTPGGVFRDKGFVSTSLDKSRVETASNRYILATIDLPPGTQGAYINALSRHSDEQEFLVQANSSYRVDTRSAGHIHLTALLPGKMEQRTRHDDAVSTPSEKKLSEDRTARFTWHPDDIVWEPAGKHQLAYQQFMELFRDTKSNSNHDEHGRFAAGGGESTTPFNRLGADKQGEILDERQKGWEQSLSIEERKAVDYYASGVAFVMNSYLRGQTGKVTGADAKIIQPQIPVLQDALMKAPVTADDMRVYRGFGTFGEAKDVEQLISQFQSSEGKTFTDQGFVSTTLNPMAMELFSGDSNKGISATIDIPAGSHGAYLDHWGYASEQQFLLPHGAQFQVLSVAVENKDVASVHLRYTGTASTKSVSRMMNWKGSMIHPDRLALYSWEQGDIAWDDTEAKFIWDEQEEKQKESPKQHTGLMVAFFLDHATAEQLALPGYEKPEDLHVTLTFLGERDQYSSDDIARLQDDLAHFANEMGPISGKISGLGRFTNVPDGEPTPVYASVDCPGLPDFRGGLVAMLSDTDFTVDETHGFTPHITLCYIPASADMPVDDVPELPVRFTSLWLASGEERYEMPLAPETKFNEIHNPDGRFGDGMSNGAVLLKIVPGERAGKKVTYLLAHGGQAWIDSLTPTEKTLFSQYSGFDYHGINTRLRAGNVYDPAMTNGIVHMQNALLRAATPADMTVVRTISEDVLAQMHTGATFLDKGFVSTNLTTDMVEKYTNVATIFLPEGSPGGYIAPISARPQEYEFILPHGAQFTVTSTGKRSVSLTYTGVAEEHAGKFLLADEEVKDEDGRAEKFTWQSGDIIWDEQETKFNDTHESDGRFGGGTTTATPEEMQLAYASWKNGLTSTEIRAIRTYSGKSPEMANEQLRSGGTITATAQRLIDPLTSALARSVVPRDVTVYRGMKLDLTKNYQPGDIFIDKGFPSTSLSYTQAKDFAGTLGATVATISVSAGQQGAYLGELAGQHEDEQEFLLPAGSAFRVDTLGTDLVSSWRNAAHLTYLGPVSSAVPKADKAAHIEPFSDDDERATRYVWSEGDIAWNSRQKFNDTHESDGRFGGGGSVDISRGVSQMSTFSASDQARITAQMAASGISFEKGVEAGSKLVEQAKVNGTFASDKDWFIGAHTDISEFSAKYGVSQEVATGVIAALSPQTPWDKTGSDGRVTYPNLENAAIICQMNQSNPAITLTDAQASALDHENETGFSDLVGKTVQFSDMTTAQQTYYLSPMVATYPSNIGKAVAILNGSSPDAILAGPKVRSFYSNLLSPDDPHGPVTVDTWVVRSLSGKSGSGQDLAKYLKSPWTGSLRGIGSYPFFADMVNTVAQKNGLMPQEVQSLIWAQSRR